MCIRPWAATTENNRNGTIRDVIPHASLTQDELKTRILNLLEPSQSSPGADDEEQPKDSALIAKPTPPRCHEASPHTMPGPSHHEAPNRSTPVPTVTAPFSPSIEASAHENQQLQSRDIIGDGRDPAQSSETREATQLGGPMNESDQSTMDPPKSTPQQDWMRTQRERERREQEERERIKAQIRHDHEERRRLGEIRRQPVNDLKPSNLRNAAAAASKHQVSTEIRIQVRMFDGSTIRSTFIRDATVASHIRPWIDSAAQQRAPYNLKIILTPQPNRIIEAAEEQLSLKDLDIVSSCTLVMVPVQRFVDSRVPPGSGLIGSAIWVGYKLLNNSLGAVFGTVRSVLGFEQVTSEPQAPSTTETTSSKSPTGQVKFRTLADQRAEAQAKDHQFYNGNQLNFEPRKDEDDDSKD